MCFRWHSKGPDSEWRNNRSLWLDVDSGHWQIMVILQNKQDNVDSLSVEHPMKADKYIWPPGAECELEDPGLSMRTLQSLATTGTGILSEWTRPLSEAQAPSPAPSFCRWRQCLGGPRRLGGSRFTVTVHVPTMVRLVGPALAGMLPRARPVSRGPSSWQLLVGWWCPSRPAPGAGARGPAGPLAAH